ncbi:MarR family winged helix-turn-helix transcriptional regulator [Nonomuraea muscovyensis]|jgi:DNA-binding MarR family transcriptional regulator|uniref:DNA-binding MarR family transcriptional regulator n=1 Tax=Nonomuraea muscovyensis TaxID=1124761 RepID=A0A7X0CBX2_9ACTN|nr:MarR family transcriptional regulator [Nonomuraea muscovyensis]MBB6350489.1 DNA-binding MarR family transcriptional regulator [Nonomuraea muscovyensis]MDF2710000.1 putative transcriptional regulator, MarR family [Nonomuraea muscovyensis]
MTAPSDPAELDFLSFVDYAVNRAGRELPEVDPVAMRLVLTLHRVTNALVYDLESSVHRPRGLTWPGFRVLFVLWHVGAAEAKRVAELSGMSRAAVSALINTLERDGLVSRRQAEHDRRAVQLSLTPAGREAVRSAFLAHNERERAWVSPLTETESATLIGLLDKLMASGRTAKRRL